MCVSAVYYTMCGGVGGEGGSCLFVLVAVITEDKAGLRGNPM